jgi:hypothetical protein
MAELLATSVFCDRDTRKVPPPESLRYKLELRDSDPGDYENACRCRSARRRSTICSHRRLKPGAQIGTAMKRSAEALRRMLRE